MCQTVQFPSSILCLAISPCESMIALGGINQKLLIYKRAKGRIISASAKQLKYHAHNVVSVKFWPDSALLISGSWDGKVVIWDTSLCEVKQILSLHLPPLPQYVFPMQVKKCPKSDTKSYHHIYPLYL